MSLSDQAFLLIALGTTAVVAVVFLLQRRMWRRRRATWERVAPQLGLEPRDAGQPPADWERLHLFRRGHGRKVRTLLAGRTWGVDAALADYQFTTGSGRSSHVHRQTVCVLRDEQLHLPQFFLRPERRVLDRIGELFGAKDFDFDDDPEFSRTFVLRGPDEAAVRELFDAGVRSQLVHSHGGLHHVEGCDELLLVDAGRLVDPETAGDLLQPAVELARLLRH